MIPRIGWYRRSVWIKTFWPDGKGHILIGDGDVVTDDIPVDEPTCDWCNSDAGANREDGSEGLVFFDGADSLCRECGAKAERRLLAEIVTGIRETAFVRGYEATDAEAVGLLVARLFEWDGIAVMRAAQFSLEDANFHDEAVKVAAMADEIEKKEEPSHGDEA
jgi:hypothetical protein